jgi:hypothetical protein
MLDAQTAHAMPEILDAAHVLGGPRLHSAYTMMVRACELAFPTVDASTVRVVLVDEHSIAPYARSAAWVYWTDPPHVITVLARYQNDVEDLFTTLVHELNHIRQRQIAPNGLTVRTCHRIESWRLGA